MQTAVLSIQQLYPQVFHACHVQHTRRRSNALELSERDSAILSHIGPGWATTARPLELTERGRSALQGTSVLDTTRWTALLGTLSPRDRKRAVDGLQLLAQGARALARKENAS